MREAYNSFADSTAGAYSRLIYELYTHGPVRLVSNDGHVDLVSSEVLLCSLREPYLEALAVMQNERLIENVGRQENECVYTLTNKGVLTVIMAGHWQQGNDLCHCAKCTDAFDDVIRGLLASGSLQLVLGHEGHPHLIGGTTLFCCNQKPYLKVICALERYRLVERQEEFIYSLTQRGKTSVRVMLATGSKTGSENSWRN